MVTLIVEGREYRVKEGQNLLSACLSLGFEIPYFCWHPALHALGACRQCAVRVFRDEQDAHGRVVMSCMTPVADGLRVVVDDPEARALRAAVIEWLMTSHPHDCPVCDEGGECHLQDMTVLSGHRTRRYRFRKRTHRNRDLGPTLDHEMNRCIACYRCLRFYRDVAGGHDLAVLGAGRRVWFGPGDDGPLASPFAGNLVEICPTGTFTDRTFAAGHVRKWDLSSVPSVCSRCAVGCNVFLAGRDGDLRRIQNRYHPAINGYFLCDRGRFAAAELNGASRLTRLEVSPVEGLGRGPVALEAGIDHLSALLRRSPVRLGIGSPQASLEANFALRALVGEENFYWGVSSTTAAAMAMAARIRFQDGVPSAEPADLTRADAILLAGVDVTAAAPLLELAIRGQRRRVMAEAAAAIGVPAWDDAAVRRAGEDRRGDLFIATGKPTALDGEARRVLRLEEYGLGTFVRRLEKVCRLGEVTTSREEYQFPIEVARVFARARHPVIVVAAAGIPVATLEALGRIAVRLRQEGADARLACVFPGAGGAGLALLPAAGGMGEAMGALRERPADLVVLLSPCAEGIAGSPFFELADSLKGCRDSLLIDAVASPLASLVTAVLPAAAWPEESGTFVNLAFRGQRYYPLKSPPGDARPATEWLTDLLRWAREGRAPWTDDAGLLAAAVAELPRLAPLTRSREGERPGKIPRQTPRASGRTAVTAHLSVHEPGVPPDPATPFAYSMEGSAERVPPGLLPRYLVPGWHSVQALNHYQEEVGGALRGGEPGVLLGPVDAPRGGEE